MGLAVGLTSVILAALLWSSRHCRLHLSNLALRSAWPRSGVRISWTDHLLLGRQGHAGGLLGSRRATRCWRRTATGRAAQQPPGHPAYRRSKLAPSRRYATYATDSTEMLAAAAWRAVDRRAPVEGGVGENPVDEADSHERGAEAVHEGRREPNDDLQRACPRAWWHRHSSRRGWPARARKRGRRGAAPRLAAVDPWRRGRPRAGRELVPTQTRRRSLATRRQPQPPDQAGSRDRRPARAPGRRRGFRAEAGELCGCLIDLRRTDHKAGDPQGDHDQRGYRDEPVERQRGRVEEEVLGALLATARRARRIMSGRAGARGVETIRAPLVAIHRSRRDCCR